MFRITFLTKLPIRLQGVLLLLLVPVAYYFGFYRPLANLESGYQSISLGTIMALLMPYSFVFGLFYSILGEKAHRMIYTDSGEKTKMFWIMSIATMAIGGIAHYIMIFSKISSHGYR